MTYGPAPILGPGVGNPCFRKSKINYSVNKYWPNNERQIYTHLILTTYSNEYLLSNCCFQETAPTSDECEDTCRVFCLLSTSHNYTEDKPQTLKLLIGLVLFSLEHTSPATTGWVILPLTHTPCLSEIYHYLPRLDANAQGSAIPAPAQTRDRLLVPRYRLGTRTQISHPDLSFWIPQVNSRTQGQCYHAVATAVENISVWRFRYRSEEKKTKRHQKEKISTDTTVRSLTKVIPQWWCCEPFHWCLVQYCEGQKVRFSLLEACDKKKKVLMFYISNKKYSLFSSVLKWKTISPSLLFIC